MGLGRGCNRPKPGGGGRSASPEEARGHQEQSFRHRQGTLLPSSPKSIPPALATPVDMGGLRDTRELSGAVLCETDCHFLSTSLCPSLNTSSPPNQLD